MTDAAFTHRRRRQQHIAVQSVSPLGGNPGGDGGALYIGVDGVLSKLRNAPLQPINLFCATSRDLS
jgi:hypothetical protein